MTDHLSGHVFDISVNINCRCSVFEGVVCCDGVIFDRKVWYGSLTIQHPLFDISTMMEKLSHICTFTHLYRAFF